jgi:hypothetical protein
VQCPGEACDDGDTSDCTIACNATCTGPAPPANPLCDEPTVFFAEESRVVTELPPSSPVERVSYELRVHSSNAYYSDVTVTFGMSTDVNDGTLIVTPNSGQVIIPARATLSDPITLELLRDAAAGRRRTVYVALLSANPGTVRGVALYSLWVENTTVPEIERTVPAADAIMVPADTVLELEFSVPMDRFATSAALNIEPAIDGERTWGDEDRTLVLTPASPLAAGETYVVTVTGEAMSQEGVPLFETTFVFSVWGDLDAALVVTALSPLL